MHFTFGDLIKFNPVLNNNPFLSFKHFILFILCIWFIFIAAHLHHLIEKLAYGAQFKSAVLQSCKFFESFKKFSYWFYGASFLVFIIKYFITIIISVFQFAYTTIFGAYSTFLFLQTGKFFHFHILVILIRKNSQKGREANMNSGGLIEGCLITMHQILGLFFLKYNTISLLFHLSGIKCDIFHRHFHLVIQKTIYIKCVFGIKY